ncbi:MAG: 30S ribosomal protein S1 [Epsilonproteobacteria bacterium]|nr:30S ribosomal protein S1 [Campylobacterota bacterium]
MEDKNPQQESQNNSNSEENLDFDEQDFGKILDEFEKQKEEKQSDLVEGEIVGINEEDNQALIDIGQKNEAIISLNQLRDEEGNLLFNKGDKINVVVTGFKNERPIVSYELAKKRALMDEFLEEYDDSNEYIIEGVIKKKNRGGYVVDCDGLEFFMPKTQSYLNPKTNPIGKKVKAIIVNVDKDKKSVVVSRKELIEREKQRIQQIIDSIANAKEPVTGVVKKITSYGMFVDVGGIDGLVHYSQISHKGPVNPAKYYKEGDEVKVVMLDFDKKKKHLSLSIKDAQPNPWDKIDELVEVGDTINVTVSNIEPYGAFVDLGEDLEAFLHVSEISWDKNVKHPKDYLEVGQNLDVEVIEIDKENKRLRVSLKKLLPKPIELFAKNHKVGDVVKGVVTSVTDFGAFVKIDDLEGLLHNQECSWDKSVKCKDILKVGDEVEVKIINIDTQKDKISLSKKALEESPFDKFAAKYKVGDVIKGKVKDIKDFGVFIMVDEGIDVLIRKEDLAPLKMDELQKDQEIEAVIVFMDKKNHKARASVRRLEKQKEKEALKKYNDDSSIKLGDLVKKKDK